MSTRVSGSGTARSPVQIGALVVGLTFLLVGVLGFIPGITTDYSSLEWAGHHSQAQLFGIFTVSVLHNIVHLLFGFAGILAAAAAASARTFLIGGGLIYLALWLYGLFVDEHSDANFVPLNDADNWLHLGLGLGMIVLGLALPRTLPTERPITGRTQ
ncbi:DUF4383 domain-containing protein [Nocardia asteroides]|uniref:DUF4383 domain-containing protein n=1 Tax=Nocardia asteroides TaxID=1824 RepID=UPI003428C1A7